MKNLFKFTIAGIILASPAVSGGWEASRIDTSMMYNDGSYAEVGTSSISYDINATIQTGDSHKMADDQTRTAIGFKMQYEDFDFGLANYLSGAIQLDGIAGHSAGCGAAAALLFCSLVPSADVEMTSTAIVGRYRIDENFSVLGGINRYSVSDATVQTLSGYYEVAGDQLVPMAGAAYENKEIALRVELLVQTETDVDLTASSSLHPNPLVDPNAPTSLTGATMVIPQTLTLNFQSGIAEDTLMFGSIHKAEWDSAQISIPENTNHASGNVDSVTSSFSNKTSYSIGVGRKLNESISVLGSYSSEGGGGSTSTDAFTLTDGSKTLALGARYTKDNMTISGGYSYTKVGDVTVTTALGPLGNLTAAYADNKVTGIGVKLGFSF